MVTKLQIWNQALNLMGGRSTVGALDETSAEATALNLHYDSLLDEMLELSLWNFARRASAPAIFKAAYGVTDATAVTTTWDDTWPAPPWSYAYKIPTDCLRVRYISPKASATVGATTPAASHDAYLMIDPPYQFVMGSDLDGSTSVQIVLTNVHLPVVVYTARISDPNAWPPLFRQAFVHMLASRIAMPLSGDMQNLQLNVQQALQFTAQAQVSNANQGLNMNLSLPDWIRARGLSEPQQGQQS